jgi:DNA-binding MarR family transcriptional regulator
LHPASAEVLGNSFKFEEFNSELSKTEWFRAEDFTARAKLRRSSNFFSHACQGRLALTARDVDFHDPDSGSALVRATEGVVRDVARTCETAIDGRRAIRTLGQWSARVQLSEPELQILWLLHEAAGGGVDQTTLATRLAFSPAQVSACVEKLRVRGCISHHEAAGDRRRHLWQLAANGSNALQNFVQVAGESLDSGATAGSREAAA